MTPELTAFNLGDHPYIVIERKPDDSPDGFDLSVKAGGGIESHDELAVMLLLVVEKITGVSADLYMQEVGIVRRAAGSVA